MFNRLYRNLNGLFVGFLSSCRYKAMMALLYIDFGQILTLLVFKFCLFFFSLIAGCSRLLIKDIINSHRVEFQPPRGFKKAQS